MNVREISSRPLTLTCELKTSLLLVSCNHSESTCTWSRLLAIGIPTAIPHLLFPSRISGFVKSRRASVILSAFLISRERSAVSIRSYQQRQVSWLQAPHRERHHKCWSCTDRSRSGLDSSDDPRRFHAPALQAHHRLASSTSSLTHQSVPHENTETR